MPISPELQAKIAEWRRKVADGTITDEELREAIRHIRQDRVAASATSMKSRTAKAPIDGDSLLNDLLS